MDWTILAQAIDSAKEIPTDVSDRFIKWATGVTVIGLAALKIYDLFRDKKREQDKKDAAERAAEAAADRAAKAAVEAAKIAVQESEEVRARNRRSEDRRDDRERGNYWQKVVESERDNFGQRIAKMEDIVAECHAKHAEELAKRIESDALVKTLMQTVQEYKGALKEQRDRIIHLEQQLGISGSNLHKPLQDSPERD